MELTKTGPPKKIDIFNYFLVKLEIFSYDKPKHMQSKKSMDVGVRYLLRSFELSFLVIASRITPLHKSTLQHQKIRYYQTTNNFQIYQFGRERKREDKNLKSWSFICVEFADLVPYLLGEKSRLTLLSVP